MLYTDIFARFIFHIIVFLLPLPYLVCCDSHEHQQDADTMKLEVRRVFARLLDADNDGFVSYQELRNYLANNHRKTIEHDVATKWKGMSPQIHEVFSWEGYEPEKKEIITWEHYYKQSFPQLEGLDTGIPMHYEQDTSSLSGENQRATPVPKYTDAVMDENPDITEDKKLAFRSFNRWKLADENGDTLLTEPEFKCFIHPEECNEPLRQLFAKELIEDIDTDGDHRVSTTEYINYMKSVSSPDDLGRSNWAATEQQRFGTFLDKNKDGMLENDEIISWALTNYTREFEHQATRLFTLADKNSDFRIDVTEASDNYIEFLEIMPAEYYESLKSTEETVPGWNQYQQPEAANNDHLARAPSVHDEL